MFSRLAGSYMWSGGTINFVAARGAWVYNPRDRRAMDACYDCFEPSVGAESISRVAASAMDWKAQLFDVFVAAIVFCR
jgi:hypothetical protein